MGLAEDEHPYSGTRTILEYLFEGVLQFVNNDERSGDDTSTKHS